MHLPVTLNRQSDKTLYEQLYEGIRQAILASSIQGGRRIPSSRELAKQLDVSRSTVTDCYRQLMSEGYLESRAGSGTYVVRQMLQQPKRAGAAASSSRVGLRAAAVPDAPVERSERKRQEPEIDFSALKPALDEAPVAEWARVLGRRSRRGERAILDCEPDPCGYRPLREAIARMVASSRGIKCAWNQVVIVLGMEQALDLAARHHVSRGSTIAVENPGCPSARGVFASREARVCPIGVDNAGLIVSELHKLAEVRLIHLTPSYQFPTGAVMPLPRRLALLSWASEKGARIVEDDRDSEFRYDGKAIPALKALDEGNQVIYAASFSWTIFPSLGVAYLIVPPDLVREYARIKALSSGGVPLLIQDALAEFIDDGCLERHVKRMRALYQKCRATLVGALETYFGERATVRGDSAGLRLLVQFRGIAPDAEFVRSAAGSGVRIESTGKYYCDSRRAGEFLLAYGDLSEQRIEEGIRRLSRISGQ